MNTGKNYSSKFYVLLLACFFVSGFTGLIYEILWTRMIVKLIGSAPFSVLKIRQNDSLTKEYLGKIDTALSKIDDRIQALEKDAEKQADNHLTTGVR